MTVSMLSGRDYRDMDKILLEVKRDAEQCFGKRLKPFLPGRRIFFSHDIRYFRGNVSPRRGERSPAASRRQRHKIGTYTMDKETRQHKHDRSCERRMVNLTDCSRPLSFTRSRPLLEARTTGGGARSERPERHFTFSTVASSIIQVP